jgi:hypothetical protein
MHQFVGMLVALCNQYTLVLDYTFSMYRNVAEDSPLAEIFHENPLINDEDDECESPYYHTCTMHILLEKYFIVHVMVCMYIIILTVLYTISFRTCEFGTTMADACSQKRGPHSAIIFVWTELYACMTVKN